MKQRINLKCRKIAHMEELSDRFRSKVLKQLLLQSPTSLRRASGRRALPSAASRGTTNWLLIRTFTPCCNSLKKRQANSRHFHTVFPGIPQIFSNLFGNFFFFYVVLLRLHPRLERGLLSHCPSPTVSLLLKSLQII